jgi:light-regulated signal transduction histidine kinase (bacteriophytochrome)
MREIKFKNQEMEALVYTISRELQSPLISVDGFVTMLLKEENLSTQGMHYHNRIRANLSRMINLVSKILEYSRSGKVVGELTKIDINEVIEAILEDMKADLDGAIVNVQKSLLHPVSNQLRMHQVFSSLIDNTIKFKSPDRDLQIQIRSQEMDAMIHFQIQDNGIDIPTRYWNKLFVPYYRINANAEGSGIGLWIVKRIVEKHGEKIWVDFQVGKGKTVNFTLPQTNPSLRDTNL